jgi:hypothetical protein
MGPGPNVKVEKDLVTLLEEMDISPDADDEEDSGGQRQFYYASEKILGQLYRAIDEKSFLDELHMSTRESDLHTRTILESLWLYVERETAGFQWQHQVGVATDIKEM